MDATEKARRSYALSLYHGTPADDDWWTADAVMWERAIVRQVLRNFAVLHPVTSVCHNAKLVANPPWINVKPVQFRMTDHQQAAVKLPCAADTTSSCIQHTLQLVRHSLSL